MTTHVPIDIDSINWDHYIGSQEGGSKIDNKYFIGQKYMRGYGILGNIGKFLLPIAKNLATSIGSEGVEAGTRVLKDVTEGKDFTDALKEHSKRGLENLADKMKQCGKGSGRTKISTNKPPRNMAINYYPQISRDSIKPRKGRRRKPDQLDIIF
jgi:hypothetical protein